jgi:cell division protein FtsI (penicillin-binding protein 3)
VARQRSKKAKQVQREDHARPSYTGRRRAVLALFALSGLLLILRAVDQQILEKDFLQSEGAERYLSTVSLPAHRGIITDRRGAVLAISTPVDSVGADPRLLRPDRQILGALGRTLKMDPDRIRRRLASNSHRRFVYLGRRVTPGQAEEVRRLIRRTGVDGLQMVREYRRYYPAGEVFAHVLGFTDVDDRGQEGLELSYDQALAGVAGAKRIVRDGHRQIVADVESIRMPHAGKNLALSIDRRLQFIAYRELKAAVQKHRARAGSAVLLDAMTGEVLAMVNQPAFNPNGNRAHLAGRLRNRALTDVFEPGSTMKPFAVGVALDLQRVRPNSEIDTTPGYFNVGRHQVKDHRNYGRIDVAAVLRKSSNVGIGRIALDLPKQTYWQYLVKLGLGVATGTGFPGEAGGQLTHPRGWSAIDQATLAFGYGVSVTNLQLAQAYAVLANDGMRYGVSLLRTARRSAGERVFTTKTARAVRAMLEGVVSAQGTAPKAAVPSYRVAGKTGTVKKLGPQGYSEDHHQAIFVGMAPASAPRLVLSILIDEPAGGTYYGGDVAAPVFAQIMENALRLLNVPPDNLPPGSIRLAQTEVER